MWVRGIKFIELELELLRWLEAAGFINVLHPKALQNSDYL